MGRKLEKLSKRENQLELARDEHEARQKAMAQIDDGLNRLGDKEGALRSELSTLLQRWQEPVPDLGAERLPVERLKEISNLYCRKRQERTATADKLQLLQTQRLAFSEVLQRLENETLHLSAESETIQTQMNALKADRETRYGAPRPYP